MNSSSPLFCIIILNASALPLAECVRTHLGEKAIIYSLAGKIASLPHQFSHFADFIRSVYAQGQTIIAICASGIVIRALAPCLGSMEKEPPVLSLAIDGSSIVPLLGVTAGANELAREIADSLNRTGFNMVAAITTSGELRFGLNLLCPPDGLELLNRQHGKKFISKLLDGAKVRLMGEKHAWLLASCLPFDEAGSLQIHVAKADEPQSVTPDRLVYLLQDETISGRRDTGSRQKRVSEQIVGVGKRSIRGNSCPGTGKMAPLPRGKLTLAGLGPGIAVQRSQAVNLALQEADDIFGYSFYIDMAGPFQPGQNLHRSDNRQELERAREALELARKGKYVVLVSSGDVGVFGMAAAFFEMLEDTVFDVIYPDIDIIVEPGITAALAASAYFGAPLGGDFTVISLSDNLKSSSLIEKRLRLVTEGDMALALYNPVSKARPHQIKNVLAILREMKMPQTPVGLATDIGRTGENFLLTDLQHVRLADITSRTVILVGSSHSRVFDYGGRQWFYTPRHYRI